MTRAELCERLEHIARWLTLQNSRVAREDSDVVLEAIAAIRDARPAPTAEIGHWSKFNSDCINPLERVALVWE